MALEADGGSGVPPTHTRRRRPLLHLTCKSVSPVHLLGTPAVRAVGLGCSYDLSVEDEGATLARVTLGAVSLEGGGRVTIVPAGASARADVGADSLPWASDTSAAMRDAALAKDAERVLSLATAGDAITVWHLVLRAPSPHEQARRAERLAQLSPPPPGVQPRALDVDALFVWREAIDEALHP